MPSAEGSVQCGHHVTTTPSSRELAVERLSRLEVMGTDGVPARFHCPAQALMPVPADGVPDA